MWDTDKRGNRHQRGYGYTWEKTRKQILVRDDHLCQVCLNQGKLTPGNEVDHIIPKAKGGTDDQDNLQTICTDCHKQKTIKETGRKIKVTYDVNGNPIGEHHWNDASL